MKRTDSILREAKRITKWNKKRLNKKIRRSLLIESKGNYYKKAGNFDARLKTMA